MTAGATRLLLWMQNFADWVPQQFIQHRLLPNSHKKLTKRFSRQNVKRGPHTTRLTYYLFTNLKSKEDKSTKIWNNVLDLKKRFVFVSSFKQIWITPFKKSSTVPGWQLLIWKENFSDKSRPQIFLPGADFSFQTTLFWINSKLFTTFSSNLDNWHILSSTVL